MTRMHRSCPTKQEYSITQHFRAYNKGKSETKGCCPYETDPLDTTALLPCHPARGGWPCRADYHGQHGSLHGNRTTAKAFPAACAVSNRLDGAVPSDGHILLSCLQRTCAAARPQTNAPAICAPALFQLRLAVAVLPAAGVFTSLFLARDPLGARTVDDPRFPQGKPHRRMAGRSPICCGSRSRDISTLPYGF